jgi:hypothetical protein
MNKSKFKLGLKNVDHRSSLQEKIHFIKISKKIAKDINNAKAILLKNSIHDIPKKIEIRKNEILLKFNGTNKFKKNSFKKIYKNNIHIIVGELIN